MNEMPYSKRIADVLKRIEPVNDFFLNSRWAKHNGDPNVYDFAVGNPHDFPLAGVTSALQKWSEPQNKDWYAYKENEPAAREIVAESLRERRGVPFEPADIFLTNGAFAAISVVLNTIVEPDDEVIFISPPWFFYETLITAAGSTPVCVNCTPETLNLDLEEIESAITERTRAIIVNSPNNPTGKIYPPETLDRLAGILSRASERIGRRIYLLSDEAYCRIIYDGRDFPSPTSFYPNSFVLYTYGKTLLTPGQRLGYIALPPTMDEDLREHLRPALYTSQLMTGFAFPNALLQHALPDLEQLSIDVEHLQQKRDRVVCALRDMGYELFVPKGTFYVLVKSPLENDRTFVEMLADQDIFVLPGALVELPGYFRISLTANEEMIEGALPGFEAALQQVQRWLPHRNLYSEEAETSVVV